MTTYDTWDHIPNGVTVYVPSHRLLAIKLGTTTIVSAAELGGKTGWIQTTGRYQGPFESVFGKLVTTGDPTREPRVWHSLAEVPRDVRVRDQHGDKWKSLDGQWYWKDRDKGRWVSYKSEYWKLAQSVLPFVEIVK